MPRCACCVVVVVGGGWGGWGDFWHMSLAAAGGRKPNSHSLANVWRHLGGRWIRFSRLCGWARDERKIRFSIGRCGRLRGHVRPCRALGKVARCQRRAWGRAPRERGQVGGHYSSGAYQADGGNHRIRRISLSSGDVSTIAGSGTLGDADGIGTAAEFGSPMGVAMDSAETFVLVVCASGSRQEIISRRP